MNRRDLFKLLAGAAVSHIIVPKFAPIYRQAKLWTPNTATTDLAVLTSRRVPPGYIFVVDTAAMQRYVNGHWREVFDLMEGNKGFAVIKGIT